MENYLLFTKLIILFFKNYILTKMDLKDIKFYLHLYNLASNKIQIYLVYSLIKCLI